MARLHRWVAEGKHLATALADLAAGISPDAGFALLSTPERFVLGRLDQGGQVTGADGAAVTATPVFEARVCMPDAELRWLSTPDGGRAAIIAERDVALKDLGWRPLGGLDGEPLRRRYVLWGEGVDDQEGLAPGWSRLSAARIGLFPVPVGGARSGHRVELEAVEYLVERDHGNVVAGEERLTRLVVVAVQKTSGGSA